MSIKYNDKTNSQEIFLAGTPQTDLILNGTSKNPIANKTVYNALASKVEATVSNLVNYYDKSQVYNRTEVRELIGAIESMTMEVVNALPSSDISTTTIYLLKQSGSNNYDQYVYINNEWVKIGTTALDLSGYVTTAQLNLAIADFLTETEINLLLAGKQDETLSSSVAIGTETVGTVEDAIGTVADIVPSDASSSNQLATKADLENVEIDVDSAISSSSENPVQNKVIKAALDDKQDNIFEGTLAQWQALPSATKAEYSLVVITDDADYVGNIVDSVTDGNMSAVTSNAVFDALANKQDKLTNPLTKADVVNNLTTTTTNVPLSAAQGKAVNDKLTNFMSNGTNYVGVRNTNNAVTGGVGPDGNAFVLGGDPSDTKHCNLYYDGSNLYLDGKFNSVSKIIKISDAVVDYSKTLSSKVEHTAGMYKRSNKVYYFGFVLHATSAISANETLVTLPVATNWWGKLSAVTTTKGATSVVLNSNTIYAEFAIPSGDYIEIHGCAPII